MWFGRMSACHKMGPQGFASGRSGLSIRTEPEERLLTTPAPYVMQLYCGTPDVDDDLIERATKFMILGGVEASAVSRENDLRSFYNRRSKRTPSTTRDGLGRVWLKLFASYTGDKCILYPFRTAYQPRGRLRYNFKDMQAHRAMCLMVHKVPDNPKAMALHRCGNGHLGCVNPNHLYWGDQSDNSKDARRHMTEGKPDMGDFGKTPDRAAPHRRANKSPRQASPVE
tara:strand:- start:7733 stop:8410 length:678 start_codon:yes stop_codon:yes gene_type:complete